MPMPMPIPTILFSLALAAEAAAAPASPLRVDERIAYVDIAAADLDTAIAIIRGEQSASGVSARLHTQSELEVAYRLVPVATGCRIEDLAIVLAVTMRLPRWQPSDAVRPAVRAEWARLDAGMHVHERGHRDNAVAMAEDVLRRLQALAAQAQPDCGTAGRRILRERFGAQVRYQSRDAAYDRRTRHGITQAPPVAAEDRRAQR